MKSCGTLGCLEVDGHRGDHKYRVKSAGDAIAIGRFNPLVKTTYRARTAIGAPVRETRQEAVNDEDAWLRGFCPIHHHVSMTNGVGSFRFCTACIGWVPK